MHSFLLEHNTQDHLNPNICIYILSFLVLSGIFCIYFTLSTSSCVDVDGDSDSLFFNLFSIIVN